MSVLSSTQIRLSLSGLVSDITWVYLEAADPPSTQLGDDLTKTMFDCLVWLLRRTRVLTLDRNVSEAICKTCFFWLRQLTCVRRSLGVESVKALVHAFVTSRVDYCNSVLSSTPKCNTAHSKCCSTSGHWDLEIWAWSVSAEYDDLHWLVIPQRLQYKLAVTVYRCLLHRAPRYLADYCMPVSEVAGRQHLRSARCHQLAVPRVGCSTFGTRAFYVAGPWVWNSLPDHLQDPTADPKGETRRRICSLDIQSVSALEVLRDRALKSIFAYLLADCNGCLPMAHIFVKISSKQRTRTL